MEFIHPEDVPTPNGLRRWRPGRIPGLSHGDAVPNETGESEARRDRVARERMTPAPPLRADEGRPTTTAADSPSAAEATSEIIAQLERQRRRSDLLLGLSSALSGMQDDGQIARAACVFIRDASQAPFAMVGRREPGSDRFVIAATDGLTDDQVERIRAAMARVDRPSLRPLLDG